jgi:hypothetical protein
MKATKGALDRRNFGDSSIAMVWALALVASASGRGDVGAVLVELLLLRLVAIHLAMRASSGVGRRYHNTPW